MSDTRYHTFVKSPVGELLLTGDGESLTGMFLPDPRYGPGEALKGIRRDDDPVLNEARRQIEAYFRGERQDFDLPLNADGTPFQKRVWNELRCIPYGVTISYSELAARIGNPNASRAVGLANGRNPISVIVPCHRVIGANGSLTGYGGGLQCKQALLSFEASVARSGPQAMPLLMETRQDTLF